MGAAWAKGEQRSSREPAYDLTRERRGLKIRDVDCRLLIQKGRNQALGNRKSAIGNPSYSFIMASIVEYSWLLSLTSM